jgi:hypothetical protein
MTNENKFRIGQKVVCTDKFSHSASAIERYTTIVGLRYVTSNENYLYDWADNFIYNEMQIREATPEEVSQYYL